MNIKLVNIINIPLDIWNLKYDDDNYILVNFSLNSGKVLKRWRSPTIFKHLKQWFPKFVLWPIGVNMHLRTMFLG